MHAVLMQDGAQQAQAVILPLLVRTGGIDEVAQIAQIEPDDLAGGRCAWLACFCRITC